MAGALANKFGCRAVAVAGSAWAAAAFFLSTFAPNVDVLILLYGALGGGSGCEGGGDRVGPCRVQLGVRRGGSVECVLFRFAFWIDLREL